ncbi:MAG: NAD(P)-dependent oxidoreductase [Pseudomonadota bacterium]
MTTILITGATGFVGGHALEALARRPGLRLIAACRDATRLPPGLHVETRVGDLRDAAYRERLLDGVDVVCHAMAWTSLFGEGARSRDLYLEPTLALLEAAVARGVTRFVNVSTTSAAAPQAAADPMSRGIARTFWPHLCSVVAIEDAMRARADSGTAMVNLRFGIFAGRRYGLGILPILVPRLRTHLVPWVAGGRTGLPITAGEDIGEAMALAATAPGLAGYEGFNVVGPEVPTTRQVIRFLHEEYGLPQPHFSVPFALAYPFAWLMERLDPVVPWDALVTRSIVHLLEETHADNRRAEARLGYRPRVGWREAIRSQMTEMAAKADRRMRMHRPLPER